MAVFYRLHQDQSTGTKRSGKWYARAVPTACIGTRQLAEIIQRNCTVKKSDVMAVLEELVQTAGKYSVAEHVKGLHVVFMPERTTDSGGNRVKQFLQGARVEELPLNTVEKEEEPEP